MTNQEQFDVCVIGGGPGGYVAAIRASQLGLTTALVDKRETFGGTCLNVGCIPSKALLESSRKLAEAKDDLAGHGVLVGGVELDLAAMMARKQELVERLTSGLAALLAHHRVSTFRGSARLLAPGEVAVSGDTDADTLLAARHVVLATGSIPMAVRGLPFDGEVVVDSTAALSFERVPDKLVVVGGGAVGLELASVWSRLGASVTVVELMPALLPRMDSQVGRLLKRLLVRRGVSVCTGAAVRGVEVRGKNGQATVRVEQEGKGELKLEADKVLVATGRRPYAVGLGLEAVGIETDPRTGTVDVGGDFATSVPGVYAIGDLVRGPMLAHKAEEEGIAVAEIIAGRAGHVNYETIPSVVYTWPEAAGVGKTEDELKEGNARYKAGVSEFRTNGRALAAGEPDGFVKVLADAESDAVLGVHIVGSSASELIAEAVSVMEFGGSAEDIARTVHAHPTLAEAMREAALAVADRTIHAVGRRAGKARRNPPREDPGGMPRRA